MESHTLRAFAGMEVYRFNALSRDFPTHFHTGALLGCMMAGSRLFRSGQQTRIIKPHELVGLNPLQPHACRQLGGEACVWVCMHISPQAWNTLAPGRVFNEHIFSPGLGFRFERICQAMLETQVPEIQLENLAGLLDDCAKPKSEEKLAPVENEGAFAAICRRMMEFPEEILSLEEMARATGMDKFSFLRGFSAFRGITPARYREISRLNRARELLLAGNSAASVAAETGFYDQSHFHRLFKANMGLAPGFFQRMALKNGSMPSRKGNSQ